MAQPAISIGTLAQRSGVNASALRFYEAQGLIRSTRGPAGRRDLFPRRIAPRRVHPRRPIGRIDATRHPAGAAAAAQPTNTDQVGLGTAFGRMAADAGSTHRRFDEPARPAFVVHWLRLPLAEELCALQSRRHRPGTRSWSALSARRRAARDHGAAASQGKEMNACLCARSSAFRGLGCMVEFGAVPTPSLFIPRFAVTRHANHS